VRLREQVEPEGSRRRRGTRGAAGAAPRPVDQAAAGLLASLRAWRLATAQQHGVPAFVIFHDATLAEIANRVPQSLDELGGITGIGAKKLERYGDELLALTRAEA
jgi:ATP-dependent DNA helicase RecQ